jgi:hypothetical protein
VTASKPPTTGCSGIGSSFDHCCGAVHLALPRRPGYNSRSFEIPYPALNRSRFEQLAAEGYNRIPVWRSIAADLDTPLSVYLKLADGPNAFLLESVQGGENWGRYSIIGLPCRRAWRASGRVLEELDFGQVARHEDVDPLAGSGRWSPRFARRGSTICPASAVAWSVISVTKPWPCSNPAGFFDQA